MLKNISLYVAGLWIAACSPKGKMAARINLNPAKEIVYIGENGQTMTITDPKKIEEIIHVLHRARMTIVKFIPREEIVIKKEEGNVVTILKSGEYMRTDGGMFKLRTKNNRRLSELLQ